MRGFRWSVLALLGCAAGAAAQSEWQPIGLFRIRDMTPFGIARLDFLPAHAVPAKPRTFAAEVSITYQNTFVQSKNVEEYLLSRGGERRQLGPEDVAAIFDLPGDTYYIDGEIGLVDLTLHYRASDHVGLYVTLPYFFASDGFLDATIESFHEEFGFDSANRDLVARDSFQFVFDVNDFQSAELVAPEDDFGDPVLGLRYSLFEGRRSWNLVLEGAAKVPIGGQPGLITTGNSDYGAQLSLQKFFRRQALYASLSGVYFDAPNPRIADDEVIPTVVAGWEHKLTRHSNVVLQLYASPSVIQDTDAEELAEDKYQVTLGFQGRRGGTVWRFGVTENLNSFRNTPDVGLSLAIAQIFPGHG